MLTLINYPVTTGDNIRAGFLPIEIGFKREDIVIISVSSGLNDGAKIEVAGDITGSLNVGEGVYFQSTGIFESYDTTGVITELNFDGVNSQITTDVQFIESTTGGYLNYKQNYFVELQCVSPINENFNILGLNLRADGKPSGEVLIDVSICNDKNSIEYDGDFFEMQDGRIKFNTRYREVWREVQDNSYTLEETPIIAIFATEQPEVESFQSADVIQRLYKGYSKYVEFVHSDDNNTGNLSFSYDELNLNSGNITVDNALSIVSGSSHGGIFLNIGSESASFNVLTDKVKVKSETTVVGDFDPNDFDANDFDV